MRPASLLLAAAVFLAWTAAACRASSSPGPLPDSVRAHLVKKYFPDLDPGDPALDAAVEVLRVPQGILASIAMDPWVDRQLRRFATNKLFLLVRTPANGVHAMHFRDGNPRNDRALTPELERVLRRLYDGHGYAENPPAGLAAVLARTGLEPGAVFDAAAARVAASESFALDAGDRDRARANLLAAPDGGRELAAALEALGEGSLGTECQWAALWLLSRMERMAFHRQSGTAVPDVQAADAQLFFENVFFAVNARRRFPWGREAGDKDFLQHVLSPRGTSEPLQRWRRHFFEALAPELEGVTDAKAAVALARSCGSAFFQYEGATTWEDFGMLTALAVHEGRCEDCSNVENALLRAVGFPACQAFTPWWANGNGNHAWTVIPSLDGARNGNGARAAKVFVKTWDGLEDVTAKNTPVVEVSVPTASADGATAELRVWNHDSWRVLARARCAEGRAVFPDVGCGAAFVFQIRLPGEEARLVRVAPGGAVTFLNAGPWAAPDPGALAFEPPKSGALGEFHPDAEYRVEVHAGGSWTEIAAERLTTGAVGFPAAPDRLYRIRGKGITDRPFTVRERDGIAEPVKH